MECGVSESSEAKTGEVEWRRMGGRERALGNERLREEDWECWWCESRRDAGVLMKVVPYILPGGSTEWLTNFAIKIEERIWFGWEKLYCPEVEEEDDIYAY